MNSLKTRIFGATALGLAMLWPAVGSAADAVTLRFQTHHSANSLQGKALLRFADLANKMSGGSLQIEMLTDSSVVKSTESFESASMGIIDGDATGAGYVTGKNPAFQFYGDIMGGYSTPYQILGWYKDAGGLELANKLYEQFNMHLIGTFVATPESLGSTTSLAGINDLKGWKFRSPPGMESEIFTKLGAAPVVMPFGEVFTAMTTGTVAGADASTLAVNKGLGLYDVGKFATYPGFHSMPIEHVALNLDKWNSLTDAQKQILQSAVDTIAIEVATQSEINDRQAAAELTAAGVTLQNWSDEDRLAFRKVAQEVWADWATRSPEAKEAYDSHVAYMKSLGILN
ncbi:C4-dicarboxylate-binding periplasmic protein precursor (plasmid) [Hartmannibacter diazotrophicus]|uniref:C4-dicarboxylate-binding periplasmic protein n=1 Tax=Hartmannibacter diazotrophicus TaxID=1482074 RepID=A0A2C9DDX6_9HYPH|nr:TRAP transporter substrate-binding protein [Hartmannibacter diazotrophicus]SON58497.1 C4-dicarboxylate-binding periplasmic protein precursor [Hartmannibacter diazotrophicus]